LMGFKNSADGFLFGRIDKRAGIDDKHVGFFRVGHDLHATLEDAAQHDFGIRKVFGAAEADETDFDCGSGDRFHGMEESNRSFRRFTQILNPRGSSLLLGANR